MLKRYLFVVIISSIFTQSALARGPADQAGGRLPDLLNQGNPPAVSMETDPLEIVGDTPGIILQDEGENRTGETAISQRGFENPIENPGEPLFRITTSGDNPHADTFENGSEFDEEAIESEEILPDVQDNNGAMARSLRTGLDDFTNPLMNPGEPLARMGMPEDLTPPPFPVDQDHGGVAARQQATDLAEDAFINPLDNPSITKRAVSDAASFDSDVDMNDSDIFSINPFSNEAKVMGKRSAKKSGKKNK